MDYCLFLIGLVLSVFVAAPSAFAQSKVLDKRKSVQWATLEWDMNASCEGNPFDVVARVIFTHGESGDTHTTEMFYEGKDVWKFRFAATQKGSWTFASVSENAGLDGITGQVEVGENPDFEAHGFMKSLGNKWGWQGTEEAFVPQWVMAKDVRAFYDAGRRQVDEEAIDAYIRELVDEHGFTGFHFAMAGDWFEGENPDPAVYLTLETVLKRVHRKGGSCHIWLWGSGGKDKDNAEGITGAPLSEMDRRNLRYLAARLGPVPGWSIGYGFDVENGWASAEELSNWKAFLEQHLGWDHFIGARVGYDEKGLWAVRPRPPKPPHDENFCAPIADQYCMWLGGDYIGYTSYRPMYDRYVAVLEHHPDRPSFEEDRFRLRNRPEWNYKDYNEELTRRGLWHSAMAGGVANIWGNLLPQPDRGGSNPYDAGGVNLKHLIKTYATFFRDQKRFRKDFVRDNALADPPSGGERVSQGDVSVCLRNPDKTHYVFYKENSDSVGMDLTEMTGDQPVVAVDVLKAYEEIDVGKLSPGKREWKAPYRSDWAIAVGQFDGAH